MCIWTAKVSSTPLTGLTGKEATHDKLQSGWRTTLDLGGSGVKCIPQILLNEPYTDIVTFLDSNYPGRSRADVLGNDDLRRDFVRRMAPLESVDDYRRIELRLSPHIVSLALLAEPMRLYKQATSDRHDLRCDVIEQRISGDALATLIRMRNVVFHVPDDRTDFFKTELAVFDKASSLGNDYREVIGSLLSFYLRDRSDSMVLKSSLGSAGNSGGRKTE